VYLSTPMIKGELLGLLRDLRPDKKWPKQPKLQDLIEFAVHELPEGSDDPKITRAQELAQVIYRSERR
jgi:hypothetical protein